MKKSVVILGGGFGGLRTALSLAHYLKSEHLLDRYSITLVDRHEYHTYTPLLYEIAIPPAHPATAISEDRVIRRFKVLLKNTPIVFVQGEVSELDVEHGDIHLAHGEELTCDYLVLAPGSEINYFDIPGLEKNSRVIKGFADAKNIQTDISELLLSNPSARILIGGGGPTGIEVAGEIKYNYPKAKVAIVEAMPTLLTGFSPRFLAPVEERLRKLGVNIITNEAIASVTKDKVVSKNKREMPFDMLIWTGGVKAPAFLSELPLKTEPRGRIEVAPGMYCLPQTPDLKIRPMVYALGDSVCIYNPKTGKPMPGVAPTAIEQGEIVAENIFDDIQEAEGVHHNAKRATYKPKEHPYALSVGGRWTVAKIGPIVLTGILAWLFEKAVEIDYRLSIRA
jgi:NADH dehydrogenase